MVKITMSIDGMMCGMCESHVNDAIRRSFKVKKVTSSHSKKQTVIISENDIDDSLLREAIAQTGYGIKSIVKEPYEKKSFLFFIK